MTTDEMKRKLKEAFDDDEKSFNQVANELRIPYYLVETGRREWMKLEDESKDLFPVDNKEG